MSTRTRVKHEAQDALLGALADKILVEAEGVFGEPDLDRIDEMHRQARRVMKLFGVNSFPGIDRLPAENKNIPTGG